MRSQTVQARIDPTLKAKAEVVLHTIGISPSQAINAMYAQIILQQGLPFDLKIPNETTLEAMRETESGGGKIFDSFSDMMADLDNNED